MQERFRRASSEPERRAVALEFEQAVRLVQAKVERERPDGGRLALAAELAELGKPGPFDAAKGNVARSWKLFPQTLEVAQFGDEKVLETKLNDSQWKPARSLVDGAVPGGGYEDDLFSGLRSGASARRAAG